MVDLAYYFSNCYSKTMTTDLGSMPGMETGTSENKTSIAERILPSAKTLVQVIFLIFLHIIST